MQFRSIGATGELGVLLVVNFVGKLKLKTGTVCAAYFLDDFAFGLKSKASCIQWSKSFLLRKRSSLM
jgi:hypothetical protein